MGRRSTKEDKNIYQQSRENRGLSRDAAEELLTFVSADRIEKIESGKSAPHPDEVLAMEQGYQNPELSNYYCAHECPIGMKYVQKAELKELPQLTFFAKVLSTSSLKSGRPVSSPLKSMTERSRS